MKKKILSILMVIAMIITFLPQMSILVFAADVSSAQELANELGNDKCTVSGNTITLTNNINTNEIKINGGTIILDIQGFTITGNEAATPLSVGGSADLTINGTGTISGGNGLYAAFGGNGGTGLYVNGGTVNINNVNIKGGDGGTGDNFGAPDAGESGGNGGTGLNVNGGTLTINGATLNGGGGGRSAHLGNHGNTGSKITVSGGSVKGVSETPKNNNGDNVELYTFTVTDSVGAPLANTAINTLKTVTELGYDYGTNSMKTDGDGKLYVYLPDSKTAASVNAGSTLYSGAISGNAATLSPAPTITTATLPSGTVGTAYSQTLVATGTSSITWSLANSTSLPVGLTLDAATGVISGTPTAVGKVDFTVEATNGTGGKVTKSLSITIDGVPAATVTPDGKYFGRQTVGYSAISTETFTLTSTGTGALTNIAVTLDGTGASSFTLVAPTATNLDAADGTTTTTTFTVKPNDGLAIGTYTANIKVNADSMTEISKAISFTVSAKPNPDNSTVYGFTSGANSNWTQGASKGLSISCSGPRNRFSGLWVDGSAIAGNNYAVQSDSTAVTLTPAYLKTLSVGMHHIRFIYNDGYAQTSFTISASKHANPNTGVDCENIQGNK